MELRARFRTGLTQGSDNVKGKDFCFLADSALLCMLALSSGSEELVEEAPACPSVRFKSSEREKGSSGSCRASPGSEDRAILDLAPISEPVTGP